MDDFFAAFGGPEPAPRGNSEQAPTQAAVAAPPDLPLGIARGLPGKCLPAATSMPIASAGWPEYLAVTVARFAPGALPTCLCVSRGWHGCGVAEARAAACSGGLTLRPHAGVEGVRLACRWIPEELAELSLRFRYHRFYCRAGDDGAQGKKFFETGLFLCGDALPRPPFAVVKNCEHHLYFTRCAGDARAMRE
jgi:hypothetical protein